VQLSIAQQLLADAYAEGAPQLAYEQAAALLGVGHRWSPIPHAIRDLIMALAFTKARVLAVASTAAYRCLESVQHARTLIRRDTRVPRTPEQRALGRTREVHLHFHEVSATTIARQNKAGV
jgi:hypothetical protein